MDPREYAARESRPVSALPPHQNSIVMGVERWMMGRRRVCVGAVYGQPALGGSGSFRVSSRGDADDYELETVMAKTRSGTSQCHRCDKRSP